MGHVVVCSCQNKTNNSRWPGSTHDARIWARSEVRAYIETQRRFLVAGDSGYPISEVLIKPYTTDEAGRDPVKRLFNRRLSGLRTVMSENIFGVWKRCFPIINTLRTDFELSRMIILATSILFNFGRMLDDEDEDELGIGGDEDQDEQDGEEEELLVLDQDHATQRIRGQVERDRLCNAMP